MPSIHIENIGPVVEFEAQLSEPGLWVIEGSPGAGKTTILRSIQLVVDGHADVKPTKRDGTQLGKASVVGKTLRITKKTVAEGTVGIEGLGNLSIADLHTPKFIEPDTRDEHRIKTLVALSGSKADPELFYHLLGSRADFRDIVSSRQLETTDLITMAAHVKAEIEREARSEEKKAQTSRSDAEAHRTAYEGIDLAQSINDQELNDAWQRASSRHGTLKERRAAWLKTQQAAAEAREKLATLPPGKSVADAESSVLEAEKSEQGHRTIVCDIEREIELLKQKLALADERHTGAARDLSQARKDLESAQRDVSLRGELDKAIEAASGATETTEDDVDDAAMETGKCRRAVEAAMKVREALRQKALADEASEKAEKLEQRARQLRDAAAGTFDVITAAIAKIEDCPLKVRTDDKGNPRLVIATDRDDREYFDELSDGEKWDVVLGIATRPGRLIPLSQGAFGELAPSLRSKLNRLAERHGCFIVTAQANDCELRCARYVDAETVAAE